MKNAVKHLFLALCCSSVVLGCLKITQVVNSWPNGFQGAFNLEVEDSLATWYAKLTFEHPVDKLNIWTAEAVRIDEQSFILSPVQWTQHRNTGEKLPIEFVVHYKDSFDDTNPCLEFFPGESAPEMGSGDDINGPETPDNTINVTDNVPPETDLMGGIGKRATDKYNYGEVLHKALLFFEAQRSGKLPDDKKVSWRGDSGLNDGKDVSEDLTGGWHDAGDHMKFGFPMASSATMLLFGLEFFKEGYHKANEYEFGKRQVKWALDYFLKCHVDKTKLYVQVGDPFADHSQWGRPEDNKQFRPSHWIGAGKPKGGADVAGETAAALAAGSVVFRSDGDYSKELLTNAKSVYKLAKANEGTYNNIVPKIEQFYKSEDYKDEMAQAAAWLAYAVGDSDPSYNDYLNDAKDYFGQLEDDTPWAQSWEEKRPAVFYLMYKLTGENTYSQKLQQFLNDWLPDGSVPRTPNGLVHRTKWGPNRYAANAACIALLAAKAGINSKPYYDFAASQINFMLGDGGRSYVVGFGNNYPKQPHHEAASCPPAPAPCGWNEYYSKKPNPHVLEGALVGGPDAKDNYEDDRTDYVFNMVSTDYNAGFTSALAGMEYFSTDPPN